MKIENLKEKYSSILQFDKSFINYLYETIFGYNEIYQFLEDKKVKSVLEIGCGLSLLINELKLLYPSIEFIGIEPFISGHEKFKEHFKQINKVEIINKKIEDLKISEKFDIIFSINVFEHVDDWKKYINVTNKLLKKEGKNIILCPNYDFPYESHYIIPVIINKRLTKFIFKKLIKNKQIQNNLSNEHWDKLNFISKKKLNSYLYNQNINFYFDQNINDRILKRIYTDKALIKRQGIACIIAKISQKVSFDKFIFNFLKIPFPYMKLIIKK